MNSYLIWIPSLKEYKRFKELKTKHQKDLSKLIEEDIEFVFYLNNLILELSMDDLEIKKLTILDKYIIFLYLRMRCIGVDIELSSKCRECNTTTKNKINLNQIITNYSSILDSDHSKIIKINDFEVICDIPSVGKEYEILKNIEKYNINKNSIENIYTYYTLSYIKELKIKDVNVNLPLLKLDDSMLILKNLPMNLIQKIQNDFIIPLSNTFNMNILEVKCYNNCKSLELNLNINSINDIIKLILQENPKNILKEVYYLAKLANLNPQYVEELTPVERKIMLEFVLNDNKSTKSENDFPSNDELQSYGFNNLEESKSEFEGW